MTARFSHVISRRSLMGGSGAVSAMAVLRHKVQAEEHPGASPAASPVADRPSLLLRMDTGSDSSKPESQLTAVPWFSLYDDGSIYRLGPVIAIFPPPALANVTRMRVSDSAVNTIKERARESGLDQPRLVPNPTMSSEGSAVQFLFNDGDRIVLSSAWGIFTDTDRPPEWDVATYAAWQQLRDFASYLANLPINLSEEDLLEQEAPIDPQRLQVIAFEASPSVSLSSDIPDLAQPPLTWPLSSPLAELAPFPDVSVSGLSEPGCAVLTGADARAVVETSRQGNLLSPWVDDNTTYGVLLTPLLPDQAGCETP
jgi:hypothetical protein